MSSSTLKRSWGNKLAAELQMRNVRKILDFDPISTLVLLCGCAEITFPPSCFMFAVCAVGFNPLLVSEG